MMRSIKYKKGMLLIAAVAAMVQGNAQAMPSSGVAQASSTDHSIYLALAAAFILLIAIATLSQVLIRLSIYVSERKDKIAKSLLLITVLSISVHSLSAQSPLALTAPASQFSFSLLLAICVIAIEVFVILQLSTIIWNLIDAISPKEKHENMLEFGIRELDEQLPRGWKYVVSISLFLVSGYYTYIYVQEERREEKIRAAETARIKASMVDETTVTMADATGMAEGKTIFADNCSVCHGDKGEGTVGPNLTDDYWLHGGSINDIFKSVRYGWPAKAMKSWEADLTPIQMRNVVSYVISLHGTNPPKAKVPQGILYQGATTAK
jgi:cytochrome c oxidase cbb3-type subunit 3